MATATQRVEYAAKKRREKRLKTRKREVEVRTARKAARDAARVETEPVEIQGDEVPPA